MVEAHLAGVFPRSENLVTATRATVRGALPQSDVDKTLQEDVKSLITLQGQAGLDSLVDGQLNWQDLFRPFTQLLSGIEVGGLSRWFDNNTFYRKPTISGKVAFKGGDVKRYFRADLLPKDGHKKAILPGPFTFASMSDNRAYTSLSDLVDDLAHSLKAVARELQGLGYDYFQYDEPYVCAASLSLSDLQLAKRGLETCAVGKSLVQTYFGDVGPAIDILLDCPIDAIGVDFYSTPLDSLKGHGFDKVLACGCIDGRNSLLESPAQLRDIIQKVREEVEPPNIYLMPNCALEFLPLSVAERKVGVLGATRRVLS